MRRGKNDLFFELSPPHSPSPHSPFPAPKASLHFISGVAYVWRSSFLNGRFETDHRRDHECGG